MFSEYKQLWNRDDLTSIEVYSTTYCQSMQETWVQSPDREDPLEEEMVSHFSILARKIPWTEKPDGLQCMGSQSQT